MIALRLLHRLTPAALMAVILLPGCGPGKSSPVDDQPETPDVAPIEPTPPKDDPATALCRRLKIEPRPRMFEFSGGKITEVYLNNTPVRDISPLKGLPLTRLNLLGTNVDDISVVKTLNLNTLWLNGTRVKDLSPLKGKSLESLDLTGTPVSDLSPLAGMTSLRRLRLSHSNVTDLTPLKGLRLQRIVFDPGKITKGLEAVRRMPSLQHMHTKFQNDPRQFLSPAEFWKKYADGSLPPE